MENENVNENREENENFVVETIKNHDDDRDLIEKAIGSLGRWQLVVCIIPGLHQLPAAWLQLSFIFLALSVSFTCVDNGTDPCSKNCSGYNYDRTVFTETIITEWDLVCDKAYLANLVQSVTMLGILFGFLLFGHLSDRFGRRKSFIAGVVLQIVFGIGAAFASRFSLFVVLSFATALALAGPYVTSLVLIMEIVGTQWRSAFGIIHKLCFSLGYISLSLFAYFIRDWRCFHIAIFIPSILLLSSYWILPESPKWLLTVGRNEKTIKVLEKAAHHNKLRTEHIKQEVNSYMEKKEIVEEKKGNIFDLVRNPILRTYVFCLGYIWFVSCICYFGSAQYISNLSGNIFINFTSSGLIQWPGIFLAVWFLKTWGRRKTLIFSNLITSVFFFLIGLTPSEPTWIRTVCSCLQMFGLAVRFCTLFVYSGEVFPTVVRTIGVGTVNVCCTVGLMVAPVVSGLAAVRQWLPMVIFGLVTLIAAALSLKLPETSNRKLADTVEETEKLMKKKENTSIVTNYV